METTGRCAQIQIFGKTNILRRRHTMRNFSNIVVINPVFVRNDLLCSWRILRIFHEILSENAAPLTRTILKTNVDHVKTSCG